MGGEEDLVATPVRRHRHRVRDELDLGGARRTYLAMGGVDGFIGDGRLQQAGEGIVEVFYSVNQLKAIWLTGDYQHLWNPGFNADRGPVDNYGVRSQAEFARRRLLLGFALLLSLTAPAARAAAQQAQGFALDRFYPSPAGAGWFVMDDLDTHGGLGGALALTTGYARNPLRLEDGIQQLAVVSSEAFINFGLAATYDRWRVYLDLRMPLLISGQSGTIGGAVYTSPRTMLTSNPRFYSGRVTLASNPDTLSDPRPPPPACAGRGGALRGGGGPPPSRSSPPRLCPAPNGVRSEYDTDGTFRAMIRALAAGDLGRLRYAGQLGVHIRPLDEASIPGSPQGSELLFGAAGGARVAECGHGTMVVVIGPEIYGATAFRAFWGSTTTALEGLLTGRLEGTGEQGRQLRVKLGAGAGINQDFGAPEWRLLLAIELFGNAAGALSSGAGRVQF